MSGNCDPAAAAGGLKILDPGSCKSWIEPINSFTLKTVVESEDEGGE